jgi:hypothetical protein
MTISHTICDTCDYAAPRFQCPRHPLMTGVVKELHQSMLGGQSWGNIICDEEDEALEKMSCAEKAALEKKKAVEEIERKNDVVKYEVNKRKMLYTNTDGLAKRKFNRMCKKERYDGGCYLHNEKHGSCSFIHKDERSRYEAIFAGFSMRMVNDAAYFALLAKKDKAVGDLKWKMDNECNAMEQVLKREARCIFVSGVDAMGELTFVKTNPEFNDGRSSHSGGSHPNSARGYQKQQPQQTRQQHVSWQQKKTDNSAW